MKFVEKKIPEKDLKKVFTFNDTDAPFPVDETIHSLFEKEVARNPDKIAVKMHKESPLTYGFLNSKANQLAETLRSKGVGPDKIVGILLDRSMNMIIGIMGILKAGGAYLPLSTFDPPQRIKYMLTESKANVLLFNSNIYNYLDIECQLINLDHTENYIGSGQNLPMINKPDDLAYVIFTSGSTGKPKGVIVEHRSVINRLNWMQKKYPIDKEDTILQKTPFNFDVSVWELFWWSFHGASMCFLIPGGEKVPFVIIETIRKYKITVLHFVPSMMNVFLEYLKEKGPAEIKKISFLKRVFVSGEALLPGHLIKFNETLGKYTGAELVNLYGPTEATVDVTFYDCPKQNISKIPIGKPIDNIKLFIISEDNQMQPIGEAGELCISGIGLARGYLNNQELTRKSFANNPFLPGEKMYKTGDIARWLPDGNIEYMGRKDSQVKIRGLRIELGEIESVMMQFPMIKDCLVIVNKVSESIIQIFGYYVSESEISTGSLKKYLKSYLPEYMVPNHLVRLEKIPLTANGKADRKALQAFSI